MGFICNFCNQKQPTRTAAHKVVTQYRMFQHPSRQKAMQRKVVKNDKKKNEYVTDPGGVGLQIVQEVLACPQCHSNWEREQKRKQGLLPEGQSAKPILPLIKFASKESVQERPRRSFNNDRRGGNNWRKPEDGTQDRSFRSDVRSPRQPRSQNQPSRVPTKPGVVIPSGHKPQH